MFSIFVITWLYGVFGCCFLSSSAERTTVKFNVIAHSWLKHAYSWAPQPGRLWQRHWELGSWVCRGLGVGGGLRRACQSVSHFQTSGLFWLKSLIRFIMHIPVLIRVMGVWHSQCRVTEAESAHTSLLPHPTPSFWLLLMHAWMMRCLHLTDFYRMVVHKQAVNKHINDSVLSSHLKV